MDLDKKIKVFKKMKNFIKPHFCKKYGKSYKKHSLIFFLSGKIPNYFNLCSVEINRIISHPTTHLTLAFPFQKLQIHQHLQKPIIINTIILYDYPIVGQKDRII
jgi:hypothetical protein